MIEKHSRALRFALAAFTFFLGQSASISLAQLGQLSNQAQIQLTLSSAFAAGNGKVNNGNGNSGNGNGNQDNSATNYGQHKNLDVDLSLPPGLQDNGNITPSWTTPGLYSASQSPINTIPDFVADEELLKDELHRLDMFDANARYYLDDDSVPGIAIGKDAKTQKAKGVQNKEVENKGAQGNGAQGNAPPEKEKSEIVKRAALPVSVGADGHSANEVLAQNLSNAALDRAQALGFSVQDKFVSGDEDDGSVTTLTVPAGMTLTEAMAILETELPDEQFHLNRIYRIYHPAADDGESLQKEGIEPIDPDAAPCTNDRCYGRRAIQWKDEFDQCTRQLKIGVIDTNVDIQHKAFADQDILQKSFLPDGRQLAKSGHGTGILALLAGRPDSNTPGLVSEATFYVASIFFIGDDGTIQTDTISLLKALEWLRNSDVQLVNMSFSGPEDSLVNARLEKLRAIGMTFAAAAGNEGLAADPSYPAAYPQVIAVTAVDKKMQVYPSANRGDYIDIAAPGVHIWTALPNSQAGYQSGTSFAVPFMIAMLAIQRPETLRLHKDELLDQMKTVQLEAGGHSRTYGRGLLQAPSECPNVPEIATGWTSVTTEVSLR